MGSLQYTDAFLTDYIKLCRDELNLLDEDIIDLVVIANKQGKNGIKFISTDELIRQTNFCIKEIKVRGFTAGFNDLIQYKQFCNVVRNKFKQNLLDLPGDLSDHIGSLELVVKGSAARTLKQGDPLVSTSGVTIPLKKADDIDMGMKLNATDYDNFVEELINIINQGDIDLPPGMAKQLVTDIKATDGKLQYNEILDRIPLGNSNFTDKIKLAAVTHTNFNIKKINFAIIKRGGKYDKQPEIQFKY